MKILNLLKIFFLVSLSISCKSKDILYEFIEKEYKTLKNDSSKIILIRQKISKKEALRVFNGLKYNSKGLSGGAYSKYFDSTSSINLLNNIKDTTNKNWSVNNFKDITDSILDFSREYANYFKKYHLRNNYNVFTFKLSDIVKYNDSISFFRVDKLRSQEKIYSKVIIYKLNNNKWIKVEEVENTDIN